MTSRTSRVSVGARLFAAVGLAAAIVGAAGTVVVRYVSPALIIGAFGFNEGAMVGYVIGGLTWASIGALLVVRRPMNAVGWLMVLVGAGYSGRGTLAVTMGLGGNEAVRDAIGPSFGTLLRVKPNGNHKIMADLVRYEQDENPDGEVPDSNPYGTVLLPDGSRLVTDAGGNDLLQIFPNGSIETVAVFPRLAPQPFVLPACLPVAPPFLPPPGTPIPAQAVTTSVAVGPDGAHYVGLLTGFPFARNVADVFRVDPEHLRRHQLHRRYRPQLHHRARLRPRRQSLRRRVHAGLAARRRDLRRSDAGRCLEDQRRGPDQGG